MTTIPTAIALSSERNVLARVLSSEGLCEANVIAYAEEVDPSKNIVQLLQKYEEMEAIAVKTKSASSIRTATEQKISQVQQTISNNSKSLQKNRTNQPYVARRLDRNAHPHFFHYMQLNREQKVQRLEQELENLKSEEKKLEALNRDLQTEVQKLQTELANAKQAETSFQAAQKEKSKVIDEVVSLSGIPNQVDSLSVQLAETNATVSADAALLSAMEITMAKVNQAQQMFQQAHLELNRALRDNVAAEYEAQADMYGWGYADGYEVAMQRDRDRMINLARQNAYAAGQALQAAFDSFPMEARVRFPEITRNVCNAPIPDLSGADYAQTLNQDWWMGAYGAFNNDLMAQGKIQRNLSVLQMCEQLAARQAASVHAVMEQVRQQHQALRNTADTIQRNIRSEKLRVFQVVRETVVFSFQ